MEENEDPLWNLKKTMSFLKKQDDSDILLPVWERKKNIGCQRSFQADRISPVFWLRRRQKCTEQKDNTEENN